MDHREIKSEVEYTLDPDGDLWVAFSCPCDSPAANLHKLESTTRYSPPEKRDDDDEEHVQIKMRVCSNILIMISPVFRKMLTGWAIEAVDFQASKSSSPSAATIYTLRLHEDSPEAAVLLFASLHHLDVDRTLLEGAFLLEDLALICDKYQCVEALGLRCKVLLRKKVNDLETWLARDRDTTPIGSYWIAQAARALILAYVINEPKMFKTLAWYLFILHRGHFNAEGSPAALLVDHPAFGMVNVAGFLETRRLEHAKLYYESMMAPFRIPWWTIASAVTCHSAGKALAIYHKFLFDNELVENTVMENPVRENPLIDQRFRENRLVENRLRPDDFLFKRHAFLDLLNIDYPVVQVRWCGITCLNCSNDRVSAIGKDLAREVRIATAEIKNKWQDFVCMNCVKPNMGFWPCEACRPVESGEGQE